eukprot:scaffold1046_cov162-Ochromonas_danica.AAC.40
MDCGERASSTLNSTSLLQRLGQQLACNHEDRGEGVGVAQRRGALRKRKSRPLGAHPFEVEAAIGGCGVRLTSIADGAAARRPESLLASEGVEAHFDRILSSAWQRAGDLRPFVA